MMVQGKLTIINLLTSARITLPLFPTEIDTQDSANWEEIDVASGVKPVVYGNRQPQEISFEAVFDNTRTNNSIEPDVQKLRELLMTKVEVNAVRNSNSPPPVQILTAGFQQRCVLKDLKVTRNFFTKAGVAIRANIGLTFLEFRV